MLLVTGITGHSGKYFLQELIKHNYKGVIRCVIRDSSDTSVIDNCGLKIEKVVGDLYDKHFIDQVMIGIETVVHIYNIHHSPHMVQAAIDNDVERIILVHTTGIYSKFKNASQEYKKIEKEVYELISSSNCRMKITILRPTMIYGDMCDHNMSKFIKIIDAFRIIPVIGKGYSLVQPVNARDLGKAYYSVLVLPEKTSDKEYNLSGEKPIRLIDVFNIINQGLDKRRIYVNVPLKFTIFVARILRILTFGKKDFIEKVQRMGEDRSFSNEKAFEDFKYEPMSFKDGILIEIQEYLRSKK